MGIPVGLVYRSEEMRRGVAIFKKNILNRLHELLEPPEANSEFFLGYEQALRDICKYFEEDYDED